MSDIESGVVEVLVHGVVGTPPLPVADEAGEFCELLIIEAQSFADLARRGTAAVGDDVSCHSGTQRSVFFVDVLNHFFAMIAGGKIEIDVGPLAAAFTEETLEEEFHADGVDGGDL